MNPIFRRSYLLCLSIAIAISTSLSATDFIKLSKNTTDKAIANFYRSKEKCNIRFIYFLKIYDPLLFINIYMSKIRELGNRIESDSNQLDSQKNKVGLDDLKKIIKINKLYFFGHIYERLNFMLSERKPLKPKVPKVSFADKNDIVWWYGKDRNNGFEVIGKNNDSEIVSFDFWIDYVPIPNNWPETIKKALIKIGHKRAINEFETKLYPLQQKKQQLLLDFTKDNADDLNAIMAHKRGQMMFINNEEKTIFFEKIFGLFKKLHSINNQFNTQLMYNDKLIRYLKDLGINMPMAYVDISVTFIQL